MRRYVGTAGAKNTRVLHRLYSPRLDLAPRQQLSVRPHQAPVGAQGWTLSRKASSMLENKIVPVMQPMRSTGVNCEFTPSARTLSRAESRYAAAFYRDNDWRWIRRAGPPATPPPPDAVLVPRYISCLDIFAPRHVAEQLLPHSAIFSRPSSRQRIVMLHPHFQPLPMSQRFHLRRRGLCSERRDFSRYVATSCLPARTVSAPLRPVRASRS